MTKKNNEHKTKENLEDSALDNGEFHDVENQESEEVNDSLAKIQEMEELISELKDQSVRALAEAENTRKRAEREISESRKYAVSSITKDLIDVLENLYRATENLQEGQELDQATQAMIDGIELTKNSFIKVLEKYDVKRISPELGEKFDHNLHQAISQQDSDDYESGQILQVVQAGYMVGDRLTRPAMVIVSN